jgi:hypothetical protein
MMIIMIPVILRWRRTEIHYYGLPYEALRI